MLPEHFCEVMTTFEDSTVYFLEKKYWDKELTRTLPSRIGEHFNEHSNNLLPQK